MQDPRFTITLKPKADKRTRGYERFWKPERKPLNLKAQVLAVACGMLNVVALATHVCGLVQALPEDCQPGLLPDFSKWLTFFLFGATHLDSLLPLEHQPPSMAVASIRDSVAVLKGHINRLRDEPLDDNASPDAKVEELAELPNRDLLELVVLLHFEIDPPSDETFGAVQSVLMKLPALPSGVELEEDNPSSHGVAIGLPRCIFTFFDQGSCRLGTTAAVWDDCDKLNRAIKAWRRDRFGAGLFAARLKGLGDMVGHVKNTQNPQSLESLLRASAAFINPATDGMKDAPAQFQALDMRAWRGQAFWVHRFRGCWMMALRCPKCCSEQHWTLLQGESLEEASQQEIKAFPGLSCAEDLACALCLNCDAQRIVILGPGEMLDLWGL